MKKPSQRQLKKKLWQLVSEFVRRRDEGNGCISCGKKEEWKEQHAGHYVPKTKGLSIYFDERNVNAQCINCNVWQHGNLSSYAVALQRKYGHGILEELDRLRSQTRKISSMEYESLIRRYKDEVERLASVPSTRS